MTTISGTVRGREAFVSLSIEDSTGTAQPFLSVLDTGFTGYLVLPPAMIRQLGLTNRGRRRITLGDGSTQMQNSYTAAVFWHGERHSVRVFEMGDKPLIGMRLLSGSRVMLDVVDGGAVTIEPLAAGPTPALLPAIC